MMTETPLENVLSGLLAKEHLKDITLRGTDGVQVRAQRCVLAARSDVWDRMLYGSYCKDVLVQIGFTGDVLKALVEYIYTNNARVLRKCQGVEAARTFLSLADAAKVFELDGLYNKIAQRVTDAMEKNASEAGYLFAAMPTTASPMTVGSSSLYKLFYNAIWAKRSTLLEGGSVRFFNLDSIKSIVKDDELYCDEFTRFRFVQVWVASVDSPDRKDSLSATAGDRRKTVGTELVKHLRLELVSASDLAQTVAPSGLIPADRLREAYCSAAARTQAMEPSLHALNGLRHRLPFWKSTKSDVFQRRFSSVERCRTGCLEDEWLMQTGVHKWSIRVERPSEDTQHLMELGVATFNPARAKNEYDWLRYQEGCWGVAEDGSTSRPLWSDGALYVADVSERSSSLRFGHAGATVTFVLDLSGSGSLSASVNHAPMELIYDCLLSALRKLGDEGFLPAASVPGTSQVRFLGFHQ